MNKSEYEQRAGEYLRALPSAKKSPETVKAYGQTLRKFAAFLPDGAEIDPLIVVDFRVALFESGVSNNTVNEHLTRLAAFFSWCLQMGIVDKSPVVKTEIPDLQPVEYSLLTLEQIESIENFRPNKRNPVACRNHAIVVFLLETGLRNSEARAVTLEDLDFDGGTVRVRKGKGGKERLAPFPPLARRLIADYLNSDARPSSATDRDPLFGTTADASGQNSGTDWHGMTSQNLNKIVKNTVRKLTGVDLHAHVLRHCATSRWADMDVPMRTVQLALGHSSMRTTEQIYAHVLRKDRAAAGINEAYARTEQTGQSRTDGAENQAKRKSRAKRPAFSIPFY